MKLEQTPLLDKLREHIEGDPISFHVPGHKNGLLWKDTDERFARFLPFDQTELHDLDDLHAPEGAIKAGQDLLAALYGTKKSYYLVNGSTVGNLVMIMSACGEGDTVLVQRNCHKSILNGLQLARVEPVFLSPEINEDLKAAGSVSPETLEEAFDRYPNARACIFTYPDYYGVAYDLAKLIHIAHRHGAAVLVDEAHGPHFILGPPFPASALQLGADAVVQSAHKTLPAMTMGSYLHLNSSRIAAGTAEYHLSVLQSSSPSYPIMASLDYARAYLASYREEDIQAVLQMREELKTALGRIPGLAIVEAINQDPLKLAVTHETMSGYELQEQFSKAGVYPEMADARQILLVLPLLKKGMKLPVRTMLKRLQGLSVPGGHLQSGKAFDLQLPKNKVIRPALAPRDVKRHRLEWIDVGESVGRISARMLTPYPPGIPLLLEGERIEKEHAELLKHLIVGGARFQGGMEELKRGRIAVCEE